MIDHEVTHNGENVADPKTEMWHAVLDHIEAAMYLLNRNDSAWSSLAQAQSSAERTLGSILVNRARAGAREATDG